MSLSSWIKGLLGNTSNGFEPNAKSTWTIDEERYSFSALHNNFDYRSGADYDRAKPLLKNADPRLLNWIGSIAWSGFTREKCLKYLTHNYTAGDENRILLRLSDWVRQVNSVAENWTYTHFAELPWESIKANDRLIVYLSRKERLKDSPVMNHLFNVIIKKAADEGQKALYELAPSLRRILYLATLEENNFLRCWVLYDPDPFNRLILLDESLSEPEMEHFKQDPSVFVRRRFVHVLLEHGKQPEKEDLLRFAIDENQGLRNLAHFYLKKFYSFDAYEFYKRQEGLTSFYIADFSKPEDMYLFLEGVNNPNRKIRLLCLKALIRIDSTKLTEIDAEKLILENRHARRIILPYIPRLYTLDELRKMKPTFEKSSPNGIYHYFYVIEKKSFWACVDIILEELTNNPSEKLYGYTKKMILNKVTIYESLPDELARKIRDRIFPLKKMDDRQYSQLIEWITFSTRTVATETENGRIKRGKNRGC